MITLLYRISPLIILLLFSCSTVEEAVVPTEQPTDNTILLQMVNSSWRLDDCPTTSTLNIEGYNECDYLNYITFTEEEVFIRHGNNTYFTKHHICFVDGENLVVSRQGCGFTEWTGVMEIEIINFDVGQLEMEVRFPNLSPGYNERYMYENA